MSLLKYVCMFLFWRCYELLLEAYFFHLRCFKVMCLHVYMSLVCREWQVLMRLYFFMSLCKYVCSLGGVNGGLLGLRGLNTALVLP